MAKLSHRFIIVMVVVGVALAAQSVLMAHLGRTNDVIPGELAAPLVTFPYKIGSWEGVDQEIKESLKYGDDHLQRIFQNRETGQQLVVWMIYSSEGKDREHHPEICMQARGLPEDPSARRVVASPGHAKPVQLYRYGHVGEQQLVFYWHYRLPSKNAESLDYFQRIYHDSRNPPASLTIEIFAPQQTDDQASGATEFMLAVDAALQDFVGQNALRGHDRKPVSLTLTHETPAAPQH